MLYYFLFIILINSLTKKRENSTFHEIRVQLRDIIESLLGGLNDVPNLNFKLFHVAILEGLHKAVCCHNISLHITVSMPCGMLEFTLRGSHNNITDIPNRLVSTWHPILLGQMSVLQPKLPP